VAGRRWAEKSTSDEGESHQRGLGRTKREKRENGITSLEKQPKLPLYDPTGKEGEKRGLNLFSFK